MTDIMPGDKVICLVGYYKSYEYGQIATVLALDVSGAGNPVIILKNPHCEYGTSMYSIDNWKFHSRPKPKEAKTVGYAKTLYFAAKLAAPVEEQGGIPRLSDRTIGRHSKAEVIKDVRSIIKEEEQWLILQTVGYVEVSPPKPVLAEVQITECR